MKLALFATVNCFGCVTKFSHATEHSGSYTVRVDADRHIFSHLTRYASYCLHQVLLGLTINIFKYIASYASYCRWVVTFVARVTAPGFEPLPCPFTGMPPKVCVLYPGQ